jgi:OOP family OmpA-OmpF porin
MKTNTKFGMAALAATSLLSASVMAQTKDATNQGYVVDARGEIARSGSGLCWHTVDWTPARAVEGCDPTNKPAAAMAPAKVAAAPPPAPAPMAAKSSPQKISFSDDALFAFDQSTLKPEGRTMLDGLVVQLNGATDDRILVTGHTDRFGSDAYNQKLSERRALAVKDYLASRDIQANRIDADGKGETQPLTKPGDCSGRKSTAVVACLQSDRRVEVEMTGTRTAAGL